MSLSSVQVADVQRAMANKHAGRFMMKAPINNPMPRGKAKPMISTAQLISAMHNSKLDAVFNSRIDSWHMGMSHLLAAGHTTDAQAKHLHHLARASALFDQFCVGLSVNTTEQRVYLAFQLINHAGEAQLPSEDVVASAIDDLAQSTRLFSFYTYVQHSDGKRSWCDFSGVDPVAYQSAIDQSYCEAALADIDGGFVLTFSYHALYVATCDNDTELSKGVGVISEGAYKTKYHLSEPYQDTSPGELSLRVGEYRRSMQAAQNVRIMSCTTRNKRSSATKANKKAAAKARKKRR
ncbi:hypothetical protein [Pseudoalteromonas umbrosa]|uniref:hypothetical protein n=1 Tax=Pseudoalteromonas umbrosa TaxID=3048489 RepID=UPI0024C42882|nr:hypothetical protein [Pseudoalteromonas sp. B95]MDK1290181.1 hypothetical protein [Pseudoalteromonas sp. B95]